jgi:hypothetical protein
MADLLAILARLELNAADMLEHSWGMIGCDGVDHRLIPFR